MPINTLEIERDEEDLREGPHKNDKLISKRGWILLVVLGALCCLAPLLKKSKTSVHTETTQPNPPWWVQYSVFPDGSDDAPFSQQQQSKFGIDKLGKVKAPDKFKTALVGLKHEVRVPWWILLHLTPSGTYQGCKPQDSSAEGETAGQILCQVPFTSEQQKEFGIEADGSVSDEEKWKAGINSLITRHSAMTKVKPPWWVLHHITPEGGIKDLKTYKVHTFSSEQRTKYSIDELGNIVDKTKFDEAMKVIVQDADSIIGVLPPWWILHKVKPEGPLQKQDGGWTAVTFSDEQQKKFGIDEEGKVLDQAKFDAQIAIIDGKSTALV